MLKRIKLFRLSWAVHIIMYGSLSWRHKPHHRTPTRTFFCFVFLYSLSVQYKGQLERSYTQSEFVCVVVGGFQRAWLHLLISSCRGESCKVGIKRCIYVLFTDTERVTLVQDLCAVSCLQEHVARPGPAFSARLALLLVYGGLNEVDGRAAGLQGVVFGKDVAHILHAGLHAFSHKAKHPVGAKTEMYLSTKTQSLNQKTTDVKLLLPGTKAWTSPPSAAERSWSMRVSLRAEELNRSTDSQSAVWVLAAVAQ